MKRFFFWGNIINWTIMLILIGSVASIVNQQTIETYEKTLFPFFNQINETLTLKESFESVKAMAVTFAIALILTLIFLMIGNYLLSRDRYLLVAMSAFLLCGVITFIGTQGILSINALFFWMSMGFCLYRRNVQLEDVEK
ncbi:hypothetical protein KBI51_05565 [Aerococcaceae bacterium zg-ZUI334]|uniref:hypothetical protein n=1 Tax=Aerococcaceae bacterium zg-252 TaxID=2796928 RepID=UPI001BA28E38|nr:hypothetical protein [Aerococcaceae bacterium zg-ZUI334]